MAIPRKVREQAAAADERMAAHKADIDGNNAKTGEDDDDRSRQAGQGDEPTPDSWEQRFRVLQGKYDSETADLRRKLQQAEDQNRVFTAELEKLKATANSDEGKAKDKPSDDDPNFRSEEELRESLPDMVVDEIMSLRKRIEKPAKEKSPKEKEPSNEPIPPVDRSEQVFWKNFYGAARITADELNAINSDPKFGQWMAAPHPGHEGKTRQDVIAECQRDMDAVGCAQFYRDWMAAKDAGQQQKKESVNPDAGGSTGEFEGNHNTGPSDAAKTDVSQLKTLADVKAWYASAEKAVRTGKMSRKDYEARDRAIFAAMNEGRFK